MSPLSLCLIERHQRTAARAPCEVHAGVFFYSRADLDMTSVVIAQFSQSGMKVQMVVEAFISVAPWSAS